LSIYRTTSGDGNYIKWFDLEAPKLYDKKSLGFACGISAKEFATPFTSDDKKVAAAISIQEKEAFPNELLMEQKLDEINKKIEELKSLMPATEEVTEETSQS
jgi:hypothetical protein